MSVTLPLMSQHAVHQSGTQPRPFFFLCVFSAHVHTALRWLLSIFDSRLGVFYFPFFLFPYFFSSTRIIELFRNNTINIDTTNQGPIYGINSNSYNTQPTAHSKDAQVNNSTHRHHPLLPQRLVDRRSTSPVRTRNRILS